MHKVKIRLAHRAGYRRIWAVISAIWLSIGIWFCVYDNLKFSDILNFYLAPIAITYALGVAVAWIVEGFVKPET